MGRNAYVVSPKLKKLFYIGGSDVSIEDLEDDLKVLKEFIKFLGDNLSPELGDILDKKLENLTLKDLGFYASILAYLRELYNHPKSIIIYYTIKLFDKDAYPISSGTEDFVKLKEEGYEIMYFDEIWG